MTASSHQKSIEMVRSVIAGLTLPGIVPQNIMNQEVGDEKQFEILPGVSISGFGQETYDPNAGATQTTDVGYPVMIALIDSKGDGSSSPDVRKLWRKTIRDALQHKKWTGSDYNGQFDTRMEMGPITDGVSWNKIQLWISLMTCRVYWRELHV